MQERRKSGDGNIQDPRIFPGRDNVLLLIDLSLEMSNVKCAQRLRSRAQQLLYSFPASYQSVVNCGK